jgi:pimeloyl-ACP methyl ester carboxylesterase
MLNAVLPAARRLVRFPALIICPSFEFMYQFLGGRQDEGLIGAMCELSRSRGLSPAWFLYGFSGGAQFCHRFAFAHPDRVGACAALAAGSWTGPDGDLFGMQVDEDWFARMPEWQDPAVDEAGRRAAAPGFECFPWLIGCGTRDRQRHASARRFCRALRARGASAEFFGWDAGHETDESVDARVFGFFSAVAGDRMCGR